MTKQPVRLDDLIEHVLNQHPDGDALQHLSDAVTTSSHLGEVSDHLIGHFVDQARRAGASWTEIGQYMGVTKQAVQKRFVPKESEADELDSPQSGLFTRFTQRARDVVEHARAAAERHGSGHVETAHLVLGLLAVPEGIAAQAMVALGPDAATIGMTVTAALDPPADKAPRRIRFSRGSKKTLQLALREALHLGHNYIGTEHILLGLLRDEQDPAAELLTGLGIGHEATETWTKAALAGYKLRNGGGSKD
ncbi:Clp protease N-terminal domain-containing protein [Streptantibioticus silvisoli]|uniref:Clp protease N-terminal domain-containing protein n=1 Tax=Streptantibioticus silvisoli TaxID=2705255 RepID=A0ABT6VYI3_9ACTN|nr:Clp protease N-terminal domain-containing protein [Streptantibioticus silvisoli]MDI5963109.1 Clp protease N-terminal domain-containing protein [Streptantibioticus silvisoli]